MNPLSDHTQRRALIVTGEASGDLYGANLIQATQLVDPGLSFFGVGGRLMTEAGCEILIPGEEISVMGLVEVIGHFPVIYRTFRQLKDVLFGNERPDLLIQLAEKHGAKDTTARQTVFEELRTMQSRASQFNPGNEVPERNWIYRIFKWIWFNDYGAYAEHFRRDDWQDPRPQYSALSKQCEPEQSAASEPS